MIGESSLPLLIKPNDHYRINSEVESLDAFLKEQQALILTQLHQYGAILFSGFDIASIDMFTRLAKLFIPQVMDYKGGDTPRSKVSAEAYTSTEISSELHIPLHQELSYSTHYPNKLFFYCMKSAEQGGQTPLLDARKLYKALDPEIINIFSNKKIKYITNLHGGYGVGKSWQECFETEDKDEVIQIFQQRGIQYFWQDEDNLQFHEIVQPVIQHPQTAEHIWFSQADQWHVSHLDVDVYESLLEFMTEDAFYHNCTFADGSEIPRQYLDEIRYQKNKLIKTFDWQQGDFLMIDNHLVMHGRNPYHGERKILVTMG